MNIVRRNLAALTAAAAIAITASCATTTDEPPRSSTAPSAAATPIKLSREIEDLARNGGVAAAQWRSRETDEIRKGRYDSAEFSPELAEDFEPIWVKIFDHDSVQVAGVGADSAGLPTATSIDPARSLTVSVPIQFSARYHSSAGIPQPTPKQTAVWTLTIDPAKNQITAITQPDPATFEFPIEIDDA